MYGLKKKRLRCYTFTKIALIIPLENVVNALFYHIKDARLMTWLLFSTSVAEWLRSKRYSQNTLSTYSEALKSFLVFYREKPISEITNEDVILYNNEYILKNNLSVSYQNQIVNSIKLFFKTIQNTKIETEKVHRPKRAKVLPNVLSKSEVKAILDALTNQKHKTMLCLIYSCGLRCGELLSLQPPHIDSNRNIVLLKNSKGKKTVSCR